jgi:hypothetical protein
VAANLGSPVVLIIRNTGKNQLEAQNLPGDFERIPVTQLSGSITRFVYTSARSKGLPVFSFHSAHVNEARPTRSTVWLAAGNKLWAKEVRCPAGATGTIDFSRLPPIEARCDTPPARHLVLPPPLAQPVPACPLSRDKPLEAKAAVILGVADGGVVFPRDAIPLVNLRDMICLADPDIVDKVHSCGVPVTIDAGPQIFSHSLYDCVRNKIENERETVKVDDCVRLLHTTSQSKEISALFLRGTPASSDCQPFLRTYE